MLAQDISGAASADVAFLEPGRGSYDSCLLLTGHGSTSMVLPVKRDQCRAMPGICMIAALMHRILSKAREVLVCLMS